MIMHRLWNSRRWESALIVVGLAAIGILPWVASSALADTPGGWTNTGSMSMSRNGHTATLLPNGKVLIAGGGTATAELYDPATGTFTPTGTMSASRSLHIAT